MYLRCRIQMAEARTTEPTEWEYSGRVEDDNAWLEGEAKGELLQDEGIRGGRAAL
jgi:hypothetical protein